MDSLGFSVCKTILFVDGNRLNFFLFLIVQLIKNLPAVQETLVWFLGWEDLLRRDRLPAPVFLNFPCGSAGKESACNAGDLGSIGKIPQRRERLRTPVFWPRVFHGLYSIWGHKESDTTEQLSLSFFFLSKFLLFLFFAYLPWLEFLLHC